MSAKAGGAGLTLTVNGSNFIPGAQAELTNPNNFPPVIHPTTFMDATRLTVQISAADIAGPATVQVSVANPNGTPISNFVTFAVNPGAPGVTQTISVGAGGTTPNGNTHQPVLSVHGRFVAFASEATNLIVPNTMFAEGYVRDTCLGVDGCTPSTRLVSAITGGSEEGNAPGGATPSFGIQFPPFVGFLSAATNLLSTNTTFQQAYFRDTCVDAPAPCTPRTFPVSVTEIGLEPNGAASAITFAGNTCSAAFASAGTNVMSGITTPNEIYMVRCPAGGPSGGFTISALVSADDANAAANQGAQQPAIDASGRFVAFASTSTNLPGAPGGGMQEIYLRDTCNSPIGAVEFCSPFTTLVSADNSGSPLSGISQFPAISDDGRFVVFSTQAPLPAGGITSNVSIRDTCNSSSGSVTNCTPSTTTVSLALDGGAANGASNSTAHAVSGDGRFVVFDSGATNLVTPATVGNRVFVRDTCESSSGIVSGCTPQTVLISVDSSGIPTGGCCAAISADGHFAAFENETTIFRILFAATGF